MEPKIGDIVYTKDSPKVYRVVNIQVQVVDVEGKTYTLDRRDLLYGDQLDFYRQEIALLKHKLAVLENEKAVLVSKVSQPTNFFETAVYQAN